MIAESVYSDRWRDEIVARISSDRRFGSLYASADGMLRCVLLRMDGTPELLSTPIGSRVPTLVADVPAAQWPEREAHDLYGVNFDGHDPLRPLVNHVEDWRVPVQGEGVHEIAVGPIHAGVIESGHFRLHAVGERILLLDLRLFYKHRGLEAAAAGQALERGIVYAQRACAACAVSNSICYAQAAEQIFGLEATPELARVRTILLELERFYNHLNDLSAVCAGIGFATGTMAFAALKERAQRLNDTLFGHRFLFDTVSVGRSTARATSDEAREAMREVTAICRLAEGAWREIVFNASVQDRFVGVGVLPHHTAQRLGAVGPVARASGVQNDARTSACGLCYDDFVPARLEQPNGDVASRMQIRLVELVATAKLLSHLLEGGFSTARAHDTGIRTSFGMGRVESPRGETICCVEANATTVDRLHLRTSSYVNWPVLVEIVPGNLVPDFPLINKSFELCYACVDR